MKTGRGALFALLLSLSVQGAAAGSPSEAEAAAVRRLARHGIVVEPSPAWRSGEIEALAEGLDALPHALRSSPGGPFTLRREARPTDFGIGGLEGTAFVIGDLLEPEDDLRAQHRLFALTDAERETLWRRRALVHAVMQRWEDVLRISERRRWRRISGWDRTPARAVWSFAYSRRLGMRSARDDLVTFAEEVLVPPEAVRAAALPVDDGVRCQEPSKSRAFFSALEEAGLLAGEQARFERGPCPRLDAFVDAPSLQAAEVLFVAASGRSPESLFGHLLLRLVHGREDGEGRVRPEGFDTAVQLVALTGSGPRGLSYAAQGVFGGFQMTVMTGPVGELRHQVLEHEARTIRRFRLKLSHVQRERLAERVWELERRGFQRYTFFRDNCAALAAFTVEAVLDEEVEIVLPPRHSPILPSAVLDAFAQAGLLEPVPHVWESVRERADHSAQARRALAGTLLSALPEELREDFLAADALLQRPELEARRRGWQRLAALTDAFDAIDTRDDDGMRKGLFAYWAHTVRIERFAVERTRADRFEVLAAAVVEASQRDGRPPPGADALVAERQQLFLRERPDDRQMAALDRLALTEHALENAARRPLSPGEAAVLEAADAQARAFSELTSLHGEAVAQRLSKVDPHAFLRQESEGREVSASGWAKSALRPSGYARRAFGGGVVQGPSWRGAIALSFAALDESLGDQRVHGFQPHSEMKVLAGTVLLGLPEQGLPLPHVVHSDLTLWSYRTIQREPLVFRRGLRDHLGWGFRVGWDVDASRARPGRLLTVVEALAVPFATPRADAFAVLSFGLHGQARFAPRTFLPELAAGPQLALLHRAPLRFTGGAADALRLELAWRPTLKVGAPLEHELAAQLAFDVRSGGPSSRLLLRPGLGATVVRDGGEGTWKGAVRALLLVERLRL